MPALLIGFVQETRNKFCLLGQENFSPNYSVDGTAGSRPVIVISG